MPQDTDKTDLAHFSPTSKSFAKQRSIESSEALLDLFPVPGKHKAGTVSRHNSEDLPAAPAQPAVPAVAVRVSRRPTSTFDEYDWQNPREAIAALAEHRRAALEELGKADKPMLGGCRIRLGATEAEFVEGKYVAFAKHGLHSFGLGANWHTVDLGAEHGGEQPMQLVKLSGWTLLDGGEAVANPLHLSKHLAKVKVTPNEGTKLVRKFVHHCYGKSVTRQHSSGFGEKGPTFEVGGAKGGAATIDLYKSTVSDRRCSQLASMLTLCSNIVSVRLGYNNIGDGGAIALSTALPCCPAVQEIHLSLNAIGDTGAAALAAALPEMPALVTLSLRSNEVGSVGVDAFAAASTQTISRCA